MTITRTAPSSSSSKRTTEATHANTTFTITVTDKATTTSTPTTEGDATIIIKGQNVSGRSWKTKPQKRASSLIKTKNNNLQTSWEYKQQQKLVRQEALLLQKEIKEEKKQEAIKKKERRLENEKRRAENEYNNIQRSIQTLNVSKIGTTLKTMSKKQLRQIKKTRMNQKTGVVEYVSPYAK